jgi:hypothetical protein
MPPEGFRLRRVGLRVADTLEFVGLCNLQINSELSAKLTLSMSAGERYIDHGHPTIEELIAEQDIGFPRDPRELLGDFWPEEEAIDDFLSAMREWRGHED